MFELQAPCRELPVRADIVYAAQREADCEPADLRRAILEAGGQVGILEDAGGRA